jgi:hypothetical protein
VKADNFDEIRFGQTKKYLEVVEKVYGYKNFYTEKKSGDRKLAMPFAKVGEVLVSIPFLDYGGILAHGFDEIEIEKECRRLLNKTGAKYMELRGARKGEFAFLREHPLYQTAVKVLPESTERLWGSISYEAQKAVNRSNRDGVKVRWAKKGELESEFYPMYLKWMKHFGSPSHPLEYFIRLKDSFKEDFWLARAERDGKVAAYLFGVVIDKRVNLVSSPDNASARESRVNDATHWFFMTEALKKRLKFVDFGAVRYEGQRRFKAKWNVELSPYSYWYYSAKEGFQTPVPSDPDSKVYKGLRMIWRFLPDGFVNRLGPLVRKLLAV